MADPVFPGFTVDQDEILQIGVSELQAASPNWTPSPAAYDYRLMSAFAAMAAGALSQVAGVTAAIERYVGTTVYRTPPFAAVAATVPATVTIVGTGPYTIPAGSAFGLTGSDGSLVEFNSQADVTIPSGETSTGAGEVTLVARDAGTGGNDLSGTLEVLDNLAQIDTAVTTDVSSGGVDEESDDDYTVRIQELARIIKPSVVLPQDFATAYRLLVPGVQRALAVDGLNLTTGDTGQARCVTVFGVDSAGANLDTGTKAAGLALLESLREQTFDVFVGDPTRTAITVAYAGVAASSYDPADVKALADSALGRLLSPATAGVPRTGNTNLNRWVDTPVIRYQQVVRALLDVDGFDHYTSLTVNGGTADVTLTGPAALPTPTITGTVT